MLLPLRHLLGKTHLHGCHFVFGAAGGPILKFGGDHVRAGEAMMERGVDHARLHALGDARVQRGFARAAGERHAVALANAAILRVERMNLEHIFGVPHVVLRARGLRADVVLRQDAAGGQDQREPAGGALVGGDKFGDHESALAAHESADVHDGRAFGSLRVARPLDAAQFVDLFVS